MQAKYPLVFFSGLPPPPAAAAISSHKNWSSKVCHVNRDLARGNRSRVNESPHPARRDRGLDPERTWDTAEQVIRNLKAISPCGLYDFHL